MVAHPTPESEKPKGPSKADLTTIREFVADLEDRGFCRKDAPSSDKVMPFNRFDGQDYSHPFIAEQLRQWRHRTGKQLEFDNVHYIVACLPLIKGVRFRPGDRKPFWTDDRTGTKYGNSWNWYEPRGDSADLPGEVHEYFARLAPVDRERKILIQWIAHTIQRPWERPSWHVMIPSEPGTGKGFLVENLLNPLLKHTMVISSFAQLTAQFSPVLESSLLVLLDDCKSKSDSTQTRLKSILSEERQYAERKNQQGGMVQCHTRFILASNEDRPLILEKGERRWFVLKKAVHGVSLHETQAHIAKVDAWLKLPGSLDKLYNWFRQIDLSDFNPKAVPQSDGLDLMIAMSESPISGFIKGFIEDNSVFKRTDLTQALKDHDLRPAAQQLPHLLREVGYTASRMRLAFFRGAQEWVCHPSGWTPEQVNTAFESAEVPEATF